MLPRTVASWSPYRFHILWSAIIVFVLVSLILISSAPEPRPAQGFVEHNSPVQQTNTYNAQQIYIGTVYGNYTTSKKPFHGSLNEPAPISGLPTPYKYLRAALQRRATELSLNISKYGPDEFGLCTHTLNISRVPFNKTKWALEVHSLASYGLDAAQNQLRLDVSTDIAKFGSDSVTVIVRIGRFLPQWMETCFKPKLSNCAVVDNVIVAYWGNLSFPNPNKFDTRNKKVTFLRYPSEIGTRFNFDTTTIPTSFVLMLDDDRCGKCSEIAKGLHYVTQGPTRVASGQMSLRGLENGFKCPYPGRPAVGYSDIGWGAYLLPTNAIFSRRYLQLYRDVVPPSVQDLTAILQQGEDISMAFLQTLFQSDMIQPISPFHTVWVNHPAFQKPKGYNLGDRKPGDKDSPYELRARVLDFFLNFYDEYRMFPHFTGVTWQEHSRKLQNGGSANY